MKTIMLTVLLSLGLTQTGCHNVNLAEDFASAINEFIDASGGGSEFEVVKVNTLRGNNWVVYRELYTGQIYALNLSQWEAGMTFTEWQAIVSVLPASDYVELGLTYVGNGNWQDGSGNLYEETAAASKDLEKIAAFTEEKKIVAMGEQISAEYGLSESRGMEIAKLHTQWKKLANSRSLTAQDAAAFSKEIIGVNINKAASAYEAAQNGNARDWKNFVNKAAAHNDTTPEHMNDLINTFVK